MATSSAPKYDLRKFVKSLPKGAHPKSRANWEAAIMARAQFEADQLRHCCGLLHCRFPHQHRFSVPKSKPPAQRLAEGQETTRTFEEMDMTTETVETEASDAMDIEVPELTHDPDTDMEGVQTGQEGRDIEALLNTMETLQLDEKMEVDTDMAVVGDVDMDWEGLD